MSDSTSINTFKSTRSKCGKCDRQHKPGECPAHGATCHSCGKNNHFAKVCRFPGPKPQKSPHRSNPSRGRGRRQGGSNYRGGHQGRFSETKIKAMQSEEVDEENFDDLTFSPVTISTVSSTQQRDEAFTKLKIRLPNRSGQQNLIVKVDTGAQGNTLPLRMFGDMFPELLTKEKTPVNHILKEKGGTRLTAYNGTDIPCLGKVAFPCHYSGRWKETSFYIVDVKGPAIVGLPSCEQLKIVTLHCSISSAPATSNKDKITCVQDLIRENPEQFDRIGKIPGPIKLVVDPEVPPHIDAPRKTPIALKDAIKEELDDMVKSGVIRKVTEPTDWVSSIAYAKKKTGKIRICLDPRRLNLALKRPHHKIPTIEELTHQFCGSRYFSKLDAKSGYWSVQLNEESQLLTTFQTPYGRYCFTRLPFGLKVSQDIFQLKMDQILERVEGATGISDDVVVYGKTEEQHDNSLRNLMKAAAENGLVFNSEKCTIKTQSITFFGATYTPEGVHPDPDKVSDLKAMPAPASKKELQEFLGFVTYMSPFIHNLAEKAAPLRELLKKDSFFIWGEHHQKCFQALKDTVSEDATLIYFDTNKTTTLETDASIKGLGVTILQNDKPVAYASKTLTDAETRYACIERELLAIVYGVERFHTYLYGQKFIVKTDHKPLVMILSKPLVRAPPRLQRMLLRLQQYDFSIEYKPGKDMTIADTLSRLPSPGNDKTIDLDITVGQVRFSTERIKSIQEETKCDRTLCKLIPTIINGWPDTIQEVPEAIRSFWSFRDELSVEDGIVLKGDRVVIPKNLQQETMRQLHAAHQGVEKTRLRARASVYWQGISKDIEKLTSQCPICQEHQKNQVPETLNPHEIPTQPWEVLGVDFFALDNIQHILVADYFSKFFISRKLPNDYTCKTTIAVLKQIFAEHGIPKTLKSDNGPQFSAKMFQDFAKEWCFDHITSSPIYPKSNGFIERHVQTVKQALIKAKQNGNDPDLTLLCLRTTPISAKIPSPAELITGRKPRGNLPTRHTGNPTDDLIREKLQHRQDNQKSYHDTKAKELPPLAPGQYVRFQDQPSSTWKEAVIKEKCQEPRSYIIETPTGKTLRRNRVNIRNLPQQQIQLPENKEPPVEDETPTSADPPVKPISPTTNASTAPLPPKAPPNSASVCTRSGRKITLPARYKY